MLQLQLVNLSYRERGGTGRDAPHPLFLPFPGIEF